MAPAIKLEKRYTYKDYLTWPDDERWELINGIAYNMSPAPTRWHQRLLMVLANKFYNFLEGKPCQPFVAPFDVRLTDKETINDETDTVVQPDIVVICDETKLDDRGCNGAPDFLVEILSESTASKDLHEKLFLYERFGVKEYWIVDLWSRTIRVHLYVDGQFAPAKIFTENDLLAAAVLPGLKINLQELFKDIPRQI
jgi:Uma2 family endonuclease